jgi:hypothetical protein
VLYGDGNQAGWLRRKHITNLATADNFQLYV